jgi:thymidylate kinase
LDFSQVDICDSFFGRFIQSIAHMAGLMGAQVIVSGLHDAVVETLVGLGMTLPDVQAVLDLDDALALSRAGQRSDNDQTAASGPVGEEFEQQATRLSQHTTRPGSADLTDLASETPSSKM